MNALEDFPHLHTTVSTSLTNSKSGFYTSKNILLLLKTEQALCDADMIKHTCNNQFIESTALATQSNPLKSTNVPTCSICKCPGHTNIYCVMPGGGMAGKMITESIVACKKDRESKRGGGNNTQTPGKVSVTMRDSSGKAFIIQVDPADISTPTASAEFAGIASDTIPENDSFTASIDMIEYEGWLIFKEEPQTTVNWNTHTKPSDIAALSEISPIQQADHTPISFKDLFTSIQEQPSTFHQKNLIFLCFEQSQHAP